MVKLGLYFCGKESRALPTNAVDALRKSNGVEQLDELGGITQHKLELGASNNFLFGIHTGLFQP